MSEPKNSRDSLYLDRRNSEQYRDEKAVLLLESQNHDVESQKTTSPEPFEHTVSSTKKLTMLARYFVLNLGLTLSNKAVMQTAHFPWLLTAIHATFTSVGCAMLLGSGHFTLTNLTGSENLILVAFSTLFTVNIAVSNVSLALVSVAFHQVLRSTVPVVTVLIYALIYRRKYSRETYLSIVPLVCGVALVTFGDYAFSANGLILTLLGVILAATKVVASNRLMTGNLKLGALELIFRMSPLAAIQCFVFSWANGELAQMRTAFSKEQIFTLDFLGLLICNAATAFALNVVSFQSNKMAGALAVSVCANVKQALTIILGILLFDVRVTALNGIGTVVTIIGAAWYSKVELDTKRRNERA